MFNIPLNEAYTTKHFVNNMLIHITIIQNYSLQLDADSSSESLSLFK